MSDTPRSGAWALNSFPSANWCSRPSNRVIRGRAIIALEYENVLVRGDERAAGASYRLFDEHGQVLALRSDMTIPIARLAATRYRQADSPLRFCYFAHAYRGVRPQRGQSRELLQAGIELICLFLCQRQPAQGMERELAPPAMTFTRRGLFLWYSCHRAHLLAGATYFQT